jgi:hypothetical protein
MNKPARFTVAAWPGLMSIDIAAAYCCFSERDFKKAVASGELPQPVLIDGKERWRLVDMTANVEERDEWRMSD